jgi:radical SAM superfamily enzyme YgiQ (UPF0313 family)
MADIILINPRFEISFWGLEHALPFFGKRAGMPVAALPLLAALTPSGHRITIIDENVEPIDFDICERADIVGVTGMIVQRNRMREILTELKRLRIYTVVGGPWVSVRADYFAELVDTVFVGEAEETWPRFLDDWRTGKAAARYEQVGRTDLTRVPAPRLDLLKMDRYAFGSLQFSRGCPFLCEFCDIIVTFGRKPRIKTSQQIICELEGLRARKQEMIFIVDDNLIGNKKAIKEVLRSVIKWQRNNGYPFIFYTEASLDLADDDELMRLMTDAMIVAVFIGIESTDPHSLREARKLQNIRPGRSIVEKVQHIQNAGLEVWAGMILGFDNDDETVFETQRKFIGKARINIAMVGMLSAIPKTPLYDRLAAAGRLDPVDHPTAGTNVIPLQMSRETLSAGYVRLMAALYDPKTFFDRLDNLFITAKIDFGRGWLHYAAEHRWRRRMRHLRFWLEAFVILARLMVSIPDASLCGIYWIQFWRVLRARHDPLSVKFYVMKFAIHYHMLRLVRCLSAGDRPIVNTF